LLSQNKPLQGDERPNHPVRVYSEITTDSTLSLA